MKAKVMGIITATAVWITVLAIVSCLPTSLAATATVKKAALDQTTVQMLSNILESLDAFRNDRLRDLEKIRLSTPAGNGTTARSDSDGQLYLTPKNSSVSEHIKALKEGIMGHNPVKKTFGYKVTVYTSPIGEDGKDGKPVMVTQYVGGDMMPEEDIKRKGEVEDLQESANHPAPQAVHHSSESIHIPVHTASDASGVSEDAQTSAKDAAVDHNRKTEHSAFSDKGHQNSHGLHSKLEKGHDHEKHSAKHDEHHKETEKESHRHDTQAHDKGGASQQGIRERTEIEYYEREHFLDTEYDKAKTGHENTKGLKEHEKHNDHDSHENKRTHETEDNSGHKLHTGAGVAKATGTAVDAGVEIIDDGYASHYVPPYGVHHHLQRPKESHVDHHDIKEHHEDEKEGHQSSKHHLSEESKGHQEHNSERDHHSEQKDKGYVDKDKGRRKEGYRERGYKITAEREYFLNDAHHDKGVATHTSGSRLKDQEGAAHGSKEGERDRGFVKEEKSEEAHDAAYDTKERKYYDGEQHKEEVKEEKAKTTSTGEKQKQEEIVPVPHVGVNYVEPHRHHVPYYPLPPPIAYAPSDDGAQALVALPPEDLKKIRPSPHQQLESNRHLPDRSNRNHYQQPPIGGYDDDYEDAQSEGYVGHAGYRKKPTPLVSSIKENIKKDVHRKPPSYSKPKSSSEEDNSVRFPEEKDGGEKYDKEEDGDSEEVSEEVIFPQDDEKSYRAEVKYHRDHDDDHVYPVPKNAGEQDLVNHHDERLRHGEKETRYHNTPNSQIFDSDVPRNPYPQLDSNRNLPRYHENQQGVYTTGIQSPDKLLRNIDRSAYPQIPGGKLPTVREILEEVTRFPQRKVNKPYLEAHQKTKEARNQHHPDLKQFYHLGPQAYSQRDDVRNVQQPHSLSHQVNQPIPARHHQQGQVGNQTPLLRVPQNPQQQGRGVNPHEQLHHQQREVDLQQQYSPRIHHHEQSQVPRDSTPLEQLQQQTRPPFSPVVLLSRGPPAQTQNQAVDVWYTRQ